MHAIIMLGLIPPLSLPAPSPIADPTAVRTIAYDLELTIDYEAKVLEGQAYMTLVNHGDAPVEGIPILVHRLMRFGSARDSQGRDLEIAQAVVVFEDWPALQIVAGRVGLRDPLYTTRWYERLRARQ